jgi:hypothetical protein
VVLDSFPPDDLLSKSGFQGMLPHEWGSLTSVCVRPLVVGL